MDEFVSDFVKFLSSTVIVRIMSQPHFATEILLGIAVCIVQFLLIIEINTLVRRTNARAAARFRVKYPIKEIENGSSRSLVAIKTGTQTFRDKSDIYQRTTQTYSLMNPRERFCSGGKNFGWAPFKGDSKTKHRFSDRVEHLLSITPSEYVRRELKSREQLLRSPLPPLLKRALSSEENNCNITSKTEIHRNLNSLKENLELQLATAQIKNLTSASLQKLIEKTALNRILKVPLFYPEQLMTSMIGCPHVRCLKNKTDTRAIRRNYNEEDHEEVAARWFALKSSDSLSEIYRKKIHSAS
ncbi:uncharacterized protein [Euwallacea similis]|uniref:uncharacterized protein n=1 Tax=Euwallacea similis TaxID=1736056 RepID=UPI00344F9D25